ncbi:carbohydrate deacetylase [Clostridium gasigenes]|uniref:Carbohydrate deacetylase n=1 Tax=Clostridium gasigenes TaxID=94869 RepID=A0A7X0SEA0_9CLOT|nr:carbohydrate deacetylase [Clostridium gasigenes]MBB6715900.1 carbohydrate deacetylase [Clostridium gasigenes]
MKLIVNGDDFGLTIGVSKGIIDAMKNGIMTDTTAMANMPHFEESIKMAKENGINEMGVHLNLTCGKPILSQIEVASLVTEDGNFYKKPNYMPKEIDMDELEKELRAQISKFISTGMKLNHIDGHHHFYIFNESVFRLVLSLAREFNVPVRCPSSEYMHIVKEFNIKSPDIMIGDFYEGNANEDYLIKRLKELNSLDIVEVMAHPAIIDEELENISSYLNYRTIELNALKSEAIKKFVKGNKIKLIKFSQI